MLINRSTKPSRILRYCYELLFCLNLSVGALFLLTVISTPDGLLPIGLWKMRINGYLGLHPHNDLGTYIAILMSATLVSVCIFLVVRVISLNKIGDVVVRWTAGLTALIGMPLVWFLIFLRSPWPPFDVNVRLWVPVELCIAGSCIFLILHSGRHIRLASIAFILCAHYGFWLWMFTQRFGIYSAVLPLVGWAASLVWSWFFIRSPERPTNGEAFA